MRCYKGSSVLLKGQ